MSLCHRHLINPRRSDLCWHLPALVLPRSAPYIPISYPEKANSDSAVLSSRRWPFRRALSCYWFFVSGKNRKIVANCARDDCNEAEEQFHCSLSSFLPGQASCCNALILCSVSSDLPVTAFVASRCFNQVI